MTPSKGLARLGILHELTLPHSPYQNAKQETFWAQLEGRLVAMLENVSDLSLARLNEITQAWIERGYNRKRHSEIGTTPLRRFLDGKMSVCRARRARRCARRFARKSGARSARATGPSASRRGASSCRHAIATSTT